MAGFCFQHRTVDGGARFDPQQIDYSGGTHGLLERDIVGGLAIGKEMARAVHMGEAMYAKALPGHLKHVASSVVGDQAPFHRPAKMIGDWHGEIDQSRHPIFPGQWRDAVTRGPSRSCLDEFDGEAVIALQIDDLSPLIRSRVDGDDLADRPEPVGGSRVHGRFGIVDVERNVP